MSASRIREIRKALLEIRSDHNEMLMRGLILTLRGGRAEGAGKREAGKPSVIIESGGR